MTDAFYNEMATVARELLEEFGKPWTITRTSGEDIDDLTGVVTPGTDTVYTPKGVLTNFSKEEMLGNRIEAGDKMLILDDTIEPEMSDKPTIDSQEWSIVDIVAVEPAGIPLVYRVHVRG